MHAVSNDEDVRIWTVSSGVMSYRRTSNGVEAVSDTYNGDQERILESYGVL